MRSNHSPAKVTTNVVAPELSIPRDGTLNFVIYALKPILGTNLKMCGFGSAVCAVFEDL